MHKPTKAHLEVAMRLLRYLKLCRGKGVSFLKSQSNELLLKGFSDANWAKRLFSRKSVIGYVVFFGSSHVSWKSKK